MITILMDCMMYQDDALFASALKVLDNDFWQQKSLLEAAARVMIDDIIIRLFTHTQVVLVDSNSIPVFDKVATMLSEISYLIFLTRSYSVLDQSIKFTHFSPTGVGSVG